MDKLITFLEITRTAKIVRSTIKRRCEAIGIKTTKVNKDGVGRPHEAITIKQMQEVVSFDLTLYNRMVYKTAKEKSLNKIQSNDRFAQSANRGKAAENHQLGLYQRLTIYGGLYNAKEWAV